MAWESTKDERAASEKELKTLILFKRSKDYFDGKTLNMQVTVKNTDYCRYCLLAHWKKKVID
uniref:Uncharacterized protein n=1 Tax=Romanomermis culicivorax TaxID=13658 RepID=A0A915L1N9_ROMCU